MKIIDLDFDSGLYSVHTSEPIKSLEYTVGHYYTVGAQMLKDSREVVETYIFGTRTVYNTEESSGPDWRSGFVTTISDESRINPFTEESNSISFIREIFGAA